MDNPNDPVQLEVKDPPFWKLAMAMFLDANFKPGDVIKHSWFYSALGIEEPRPDTPKETADKADLRYLAGFGKLRDHLLRDHQIFLGAVNGIGYQWVLPGLQTKVAYEQLQADLNKALRKGALGIMHIDHTAITDAEKKENADALAKVGQFSSMKRKQLSRLQSPPAITELPAG